tara:strand:- start:275 stop:550 length:276 start_codon:yes stop_codon:yes gene_type:complete
MDERMAILDSLVIKQAVRDVASKNPDLSDKALLYFHSSDFQNLCSRNKIDGNAISESIKGLSRYPILSRKKIASDIARIIDRNFVEEVMSK